MNKNELLAAVAHADLTEGEVIIKIADRWVCGRIIGMDVHAETGEVAEFEIRGKIKS